MQDILQVAANGLIAGSTVALLAISYSLIYSILRFINFMFGEILMLSAYAFYFLYVQMSFPAWIAAGGSIAALSLFGAIMQVAAYRPFYRQSRLACLITALGVSLVIQNLALIVFQGSPLATPSSALNQVIRLGPVAITYAQILIFIVACFLFLVVDAFVYRSLIGLRLRALADNLTMTEIFGVDVNRAIAAVFLLGSSLAALVGVLYSFESVIKPTMGTSPGIQAFAACVVGGIGSVRGAVFAALGIAVAGHFVSFVLPTVAPETTAYAILLLALIISPGGIAQIFSAYGSAASKPRIKRENAA